METIVLNEGHALKMSQRNEVKSPSDDKKEKRKIKRTYLLVCLGVVLLFSGYASMVLLQSSINIVGGLGAKVTAVIYGTSILFGIFVVPITVRLLGAKKSMILSEVIYIVYVIANAYPKEWLLMIAAVLVAFAGSAFWVPVGLLFSYYGHLYHKHSRKSEQACVREFSGIMFSMFHLNMVFGNVFIFVILHFMKSSDSQDNLEENPHLYNNSTTSNVLNTTDVKTEVTQFYHCGANDCQDPKHTLEHINQYVPSNPIAIYVLILTFVVIMISGCVLHIYLLPEVPMNFISGKIEYANDSQEGSLQGVEAEAEDGAQTQKCNKAKLVLKESWIAVKDLFARSVDPRQILIYPINTYLGLHAGFFYGEVTRAYVSCIMGVSKIGICTVLFAVVNSISSYGCGKIMGRSGMMPVLFLASVVDMAVYIFCTIWIPTAATSWLIYLIFFAMGITSACLNMLNANLYAETFNENRELSYNMWCIVFSVGFALQFAWSTHLCVRHKLYVQIGVLLLSVVTTVFLRHKYKTNRKV